MRTFSCFVSFRFSYLQSKYTCKFHTLKIKIFRHIFFCISVPVIEVGQPHTNGQGVQKVESRRASESSSSRNHQPPSTPTYLASTTQLSHFQNQHRQHVRRTWVIKIDCASSSANLSQPHHNFLPPSSRLRRTKLLWPSKRSSLELLYYIYVSRGYTDTLEICSPCHTNSSRSALRDRRRQEAHLERRMQDWNGSVHDRILVRKRDRRCILGWRIWANARGGFVYKQWVGCPWAETWSSKPVVRILEDSETMLQRTSNMPTFSLLLSSFLFFFLRNSISSDNIIEVFVLDPNWCREKWKI